ncbi:MAG: SLBB domain-containing protein [Bacteroidaceae bacterium]|nr:SLBB domain-containing protein [Bacteroidaceae bacterium]
MIRKPIFSLFLLAAVLFVTPASAQMSDEAAISYVKKGLANGKSQNQLISELSLKGVTKEQALRIKKQMESEDKGGSLDLQSVSRMRSSQSVKTAPTKAPVVQQPQVSENQVFGHNVFSIKSLTFAPIENLATPVDYKLGPGDEVIIDVWGTNQATIRQIISPDGFINIEEIGLIYLGGMTIEEANDYVRRKLASIYSVGNENAQSEIKLTLGAIRTITVNVMGEVVAPGTYSLSSLSTVYHALYRAGGFNNLGSVRNVSLVRNGKKIADIDVYDFIINGKPAEDIILQDGDVVLVPTYEIIVALSGNVKRPMRYEIKKGENIANLVDFSGGFRGDAYTANVTVERRNGRELQIYTVENADFSSFELLDGDRINVGEIIQRYENRVEIQGAVYRPGHYQLNDKVNTISELIAIADGLRGDAFTNRALLHREREDYTLELIPIDIDKVLNGSATDLELQKNDVLTIPSINAIRDLGVITIVGQVAHPGDYRFAENTTIEDAILQAGGLLEAASTAKVDVSRRIKNPESTEESDTLAQLFSFSIDSDYKINGGETFILEPYDRIYVRKSPSYSSQSHVHVRGEVLFPGSYVLTNKSMRLSDAIKLSGGVSSLAYVRGAKLNRRMNENERKQLLEAAEIIENGEAEDTKVDIDITEVYTIGINLEKALKNPGSDADLVLREGDEIIIPEYTNTVKISGCVLRPTTVTYDPKMTVSDYIVQAGGYGFRARKGKAYIVYMNGTANKGRRSARKVIEPGCEIIVPDRAKNDAMLANTLGIATTSASIATMLGTVYNIIK